MDGYRSCDAVEVPPRYEGTVVRVVRAPIIYICSVCRVFLPHLGRAAEEWLDLHERARWFCIFMFVVLRVVDRPQVEAELGSCQHSETTQYIFS